MQRIGLYYPYIQFRDEKWMKITALYWPRMARVVPHGFPVVDHETVTALRTELDFLVDLDPQEAAEAVAPRFLRVLNDHVPNCANATWPMQRVACRQTRPTSLAM
ncbi:DUF6236 family protein [Streptomyces mirabilis]|uniref:Uncharacterized protein n=1 Tax=Streptomyces mirabilis TaxID=68239 RepID=A0A1I2QH82_9ACTN|nr:DUF6236 family protein [Streptomyces mirabilis]SFG27330.1 hypothetical protein SAMN02787118_11829 [Streptomyces mirabilis]